ncbi:MAG: PAS domain-containing protein [Alphaproteobacteria bacterium]|nr:PAS domain-containing protein [Alphaproteobacteria bacterium]
MAAMTDILRAPSLPKRSMLATYLGFAVLLAASGAGLWWGTRPPMADKNLVELVFFVYAPLALLVALAVREATRAGERFSSTGFIGQVDQLQKRLNEQDDLIRSISDYAPSALTIYNDKNEYWFVNKSAAERLGLSAGTVVGKMPAALLGADKGRRIERSLDEVRKTGQALDQLEQEQAGGKRRYTQTHYLPMPPVGTFSGGVVAREEDVTQIMVERERREDMLRQVIATLVAVVDRRDPYASGHSARVGRLARMMATEMQLSERDVEAAEIAGSLMNFGKVLVSRSILTKNGGLTQDELQRIRDGIMTSADILALIDFGAPVVPTLRQALERVDGKGVPDGLKADAILITARIVAVANAYVALVSPRAYRPGMDLLEAIERLEQDAGAAFDPRVIAALQNYLRKNAGQLGWLTVVRAV